MQMVDCELERGGKVNILRPKLVFYIQRVSNKGRNQRAGAMPPRHFHHLCDEVCHEDETEK